PVKAMAKALEKAGLQVSDIDYFEINEAFSCVPIVNAKEMNIPHEKIGYRESGKIEKLEHKNVRSGRNSSGQHVTNQIVTPGNKQDNINQQPLNQRNQNYSDPVGAAGKQLDYPLQQARSGSSSRPAD